MADDSLKFPELRKLCAAEKVSSAATGELIKITESLTDFEKNERKNLRSPTQQIKDLNRIAAAAAELQSAVMSAGHSWFALDIFLEEHITLLEGIDPNSRNLCTVLDSVAKLSRSASVAIKCVEAKHPRRTVGRIPVLDSYMNYVGFIARAVMVCHIEPGDNGPFRRLCDAVFVAAKVRATSQGAVKKFLLERRLIFKSFGACL